MEEVEKGMKSPNIIHVLLYSLLVVALALSVYFNFAKTDTKTFEALPETVQSQYVKSTIYSELQTAFVELKAELAAAKKSLIQKEDQLDSHSEDMVEIEQVSSSVDMPVSKVKDFAQCYEMENASYKVSSLCRKNIIAYVEKHKDAKYFEIIGVVDNLEFNLFNNLQNNKSLYKRLGVNQRVIDKMKKLTRRGLSKERASEASWVIKSYTKRKAATYNANYEIVSKKGQRGVIIRAYK